MPELFFKGKEFVYNHHLAVPFRPLIPDPRRSVGASGKAERLDGNLIIHGDKLHALKALLPLYAGKGRLHLHRPALQHRQRGLVLQRQREQPDDAGVAGGQPGRDRGQAAA